MTDTSSLELADLRDALSRLDAQVHADVTPLREVTTLLVRERSDSLVRRAALPPAIDATVELVVSGLYFGALAHAASPVHAVCAALSAGTALALAITSIVQVLALRTLDPAAPVVGVQLRLGRVFALRVGVWRWVLLTAPVTWTPFFVATVESALVAATEGASPGVFGAGHVAVSAAVGLAVSLVLWGASRTIARRFGDARWLRGLTADLAGARLEAARAFVDRAAALDTQSTD